MILDANKTPAEIIKERAFGRTYSRDIYSGVNIKWYKDSWKKFDELKDIDQKYYCSNYCDISVNKYGVTVEHFGKIKDGLFLYIIMVGFNDILDIG